jgi:hypothetical protein
MPEQPLNEKILRLHVAVHSTRVESLMGVQHIVNWCITHDPEHVEEGACGGFDEAAGVLSARIRELLLVLAGGADADLVRRTNEGQASGI